MKVVINGVEKDFNERELIEKIRSMPIYSELLDVTGVDEAARNLEVQGYLPDVTVQYLLIAALAKVSVGLAKRHCVNQDMSANVLNIGKFSVRQSEDIFDMYSCFVTELIQEELKKSRETKND